MDIGISQHLEHWANQQFADEAARAEAITLLSALWESDADYFASKSHSWWELLDMAKRNQAMALQSKLKLCRGCGKQMSRGFHDIEPDTCNSCGRNNGKGGQS